MALFFIFIPPIQQAAKKEVETRLHSPPVATDDRLYIPQIGVNVAIVTGSDQTALEKGAWHRKPENGNPARGGNFILSAHRFVMSFTPSGTAIKSPFYNIDQLHVGDPITVDYQGKRYRYSVSRTYRVMPSQTEIEASSNTPKMTLYSCTLRGSADGRDVIEASPL